MITIGMNYKILPGKEDNFERMFKNVLHSLETAPGHSKSALYKDVNDLQSYLIVSEWAAEDAFHAFVQSEKFKNVVDWGKEHILADRPVHTVYRGTEHAAPFAINMQTSEA
jgi:heme-degrading monooxygenase HmoA